MTTVTWNNYRNVSVNRLKQVVEETSFTTERNIAARYELRRRKLRLFFLFSLFIGTAGLTLLSIRLVPEGDGLPEWLNQLALTVLNRLK